MESRWSQVRLLVLFEPAWPNRRLLHSDSGHSVIGETQIPLSNPGGIRLRMALKATACHLGLFYMSPVIQNLALKFIISCKGSDPL